MTSADFDFIASLLKERSGLIINSDKLYLLQTRLMPILKDHKLAGLSELVCVLRRPGTAALKDQVVDAMTTNETSFFRDHHPFETLRKSIIPALIERRKEARALRIWSAACSTGQEPYSIAMILKDHFPTLAGWNVDIVATDISPTVLARAKEGTYSTFEIQRGMPIQSLIRHFDQTGSQWQAKNELRRAVTFKMANLLEDFSSLGTFDIVMCRNVLIYFEQETKRMILSAMARRMPNDGSLVLGGAESMFGICDAFAPVSGLKGVYGISKSIRTHPNAQAQRATSLIPAA
jgi:chemotaxis protein methyltransferase CheR